MHVGLLRRRTDRLEALAGEIRAAGGEAFALAADVGTRADVEAAIGAVVEAPRADRPPRQQRRLRAPRPLQGPRRRRHRAHDAGQLSRHRVRDQGRPAADACAAAGLDRQRLVGSREARQPDESAYSATKFAVAGLSEALQYEFAPFGIHVMTVYPALVRTEMFTPDVIARMPRAGSFLEPPVFVRHVLRALERGRHEVTVPRYVGIAYAIRALFPTFHRRMTARIRLPVLPDLTT
jgi:short-subunit dehydrogenase